MAQHWHNLLTLRPQSAIYLTLVESALLCTVVGVTLHSIQRSSSRFDKVTLELLTAVHTPAFLLINEPVPRALLVRLLLLPIYPSTRSTFRQHGRTEPR